MLNHPIICQGAERSDGSRSRIFLRYTDGEPGIKVNTYGHGIVWIECPEHQIYRVLSEIIRAGHPFIDSIIINLPRPCKATRKAQS